MPSCVQHQPHAATSPLMSFARRLSASRPRCELGSGQAPYPGRWTAQREPPPYELNASVWMQMGLNEIRDAKPPGHKHDWGRCAKPRVLYDWSPEQCSLLPFERDDVCSGCVLGRQVLFVGDSTTSQLFTSFVLLLGGTFGKNRVRGSTTVMLTASVCNDSELRSQRSAPMDARYDGASGSGALRPHPLQLSVGNAGCARRGCRRHRHRPALHSIALSSAARDAASGLLLLHRKHQSHAFFAGRWR
jgi:hypothetical protein